VYHLVLVALTLTVLFLGWQMIQATPRVVSMYLPPRITSIVGYFMFFIGTFGAVFAPYAGNGGRGLISCFLVMVVGLWFVLAPSSGQRGSYRDDLMLKRIFAMLGVMFGVMIASVYVGGAHAQGVAVLDLVLVTAGFWMTTNFLHRIDRGRW
jgi:hypothetical protein